MVKLKTRKVGRSIEYYLLAKEGDSILYNDWFPIDSEGVVTKDCLCKLPECSVTAWAIRNRINNPEKYEFKTLWEIVKTPSVRHPPKGTVVKKNPVKAGRKGNPVKSGRKRKPVVLTKSEEQYIWMMSLMKPGSEAHKVI